MHDSDSYCRDLEENSCILMEFKRTCGVSFATTVVLLQFLQLLCPPGNLHPKTKHQLVKFAHTFKSPHSRVHFCCFCNGSLLRNERCTNAQCLKSEPNSPINISPDNCLWNIISDVQYYKSSLLVYIT